MLLASVLHRCPDPAAAARVPRGHVLVLEDGAGDSLPGHLDRVTDALVNLEFGSPHGERSGREWPELLAACGLSAVQEQGFISRFGGLEGRHRLYVPNRL